MPQYPLQRNDMASIPNNNKINLRKKYPTWRWLTISLLEVTQRKERDLSETFIKLKF